MRRMLMAKAVRSNTNFWLDVAQRLFSIPEHFDMEIDFLTRQILVDPNYYFRNGLFLFIQIVFCLLFLTESITMRIRQMLG